MRLYYKTDLLISLREVISVESKDNTKPPNTFLRQNAELLNVTLRDTYIDHLPFRSEYSHSLHCPTPCLLLLA
jgi:hypothetical protein